MVTVSPPTFEHHHDGFGVQYECPRISWRFSSTSDNTYNWEQTAYEIEIRAVFGNEIEAFTVDGQDSVLVPWPSPKRLISRDRRLVRVRCYGRYLSSQHGLPLGVQSDNKVVTDWSGWSPLEIALLNDTDWAARMITLSDPWPLNPNGSARPVRFYKTFNLPSAIGKARLYITSHGLYTARINGLEVGDHCLSPGCQSYHKRLHYQIYDVGQLLTVDGPNEIEIEVAAGWFASSWSWEAQRFIYGRELGVMAQLEADLQDSADVFSLYTDPTWSASSTALVSSEIYNGEVYDQRLCSSGKLDHFSTRASSIPVSKLVSPEAAPVRVTETIKPIRLFRSRSGKAVIADFGQNFAGRVRVTRIHKPAGSSITFCHTEAVQDSDIMRRPLRTAEATDVLTCGEDEILNWHPRYTYHGFRYVEITGWDTEDQDCPLTPESIVAEVLHTDMRRSGWFSCSDDDVNRLHENSLWGMKSNFMSVPTECPSRDERLGWTGDLNMFASTANFLYDTAGILRHWLDDLYLDQMEESVHWRKGVVPLFVPNCLLKREADGAGWDPMPNGVWGDAAVMVPWALYCASGDMKFLDRQYDSMCQYLDQGVTRGEDSLWDPEQWQFGDWLDPRAPQNDSGRGTTDGTFVADCFLVASTRIAAEVARLLDKTEDAYRFTFTGQTLVQSWRTKYLTGAGLVAPDTATALSLALHFDLIPHSARKTAAARLARVVRLHDFKITTGFVGTAFVSHALSSTGYDGLAYAMLFQKGYPSYLYPVTMGATTVWERWDSVVPDGSVNPGSMTSLNHHALGSIAHWLHSSVVGLESLEPGWKVFRVRPRPCKRLDWAEAIYESAYGRIEARWTLEESTFTLRLRVPPNSQARVIMPAANAEPEEKKVGSGSHVFVCHFTQTGWPAQALLPPWGRAEF